MTEKDAAKRALRGDIPDQEIGNYAVAERVPGVRWVKRDGKRVLQEAWNVRRHEGDKVVDACIEWRDVPTVDE